MANVNPQSGFANSMKTKKLKKCGELLEIKIQDQLLLMKDVFYSLQ